MQISSNQKVGDLVARNYKTADVFLKNGIDFCCGGNISISEICQKQSVDIEKLLLELQSVVTIKDVESELLNRLTLSGLIDHIIETHHTFVVENLVSIPPYLEKLADVHGANHPELKKVEALFHDIVQELTDHLQKEEEILFPYIKKMEAGAGDSIKGYASFSELLDVLHSEHDAAGNGMRTINELTGGFVPPADGCNTYRVGLAKLKAFENDLHRHVHLENNILFPKALLLEKK
jgi:regulator of cell morphogenesis and NO signaling